MWARNLTRPSFDPTTVQYTLIAADGSGYAPDPSQGTGPEVSRPATVTRPGGLAEAELAFQVPVGDHRFRLAFDPSGQGQTVLVALGR